MNKNDRLHGFVVERAVPLAELDGTLYEMVHEKTGLKLCWVKRAEENKTFAITFRTLPWNNTGVFHILEHSVLCGSDKYPVKEPFVELMKNSMNTFLNAITFPDKTMYPISSRNDKDYLNLMRVYLDAVFCPAIYHKPEIFRQEGWHYEFDENGESSYKGVVFNEMKGAFADADELYGMLAERALFPDTPYGFVSGGDPESIPDLSYEDFVGAHRKFYSPSNGFVFLDGDLDLEAVLTILDQEYLARFDRGQEIPVPALQKPVDGGTQRASYEIGPEEDETGKTRLGYGFVAGDFSEIQKQTALNVLADVLCGDNMAPLSRAILDKKLAAAVTMYLSDSVQQPWMALNLRDLEAQNCDEAERVLFAELERQAAGALDHDRVKASLANWEFKMRERDFGSYPLGLILGFQAMDSWLYGGKPEAKLEVGDLFENLRKKLDEGYFEDLIREIFLNNPHKCKVVLDPSKQAGEARRQREADRLARESAAWTEEKKRELQAQQEILEAWQHSEDAPEDLAKLPRLTLADIQGDPEDQPTEVLTLHGTPVLLHRVETGGISYVNLYFDAPGYGEEDLSRLSFLCELLGQVDTEKSTAEELANRIRLLCGGMGFRVMPHRKEGGGFGVKFCASFSALDQNLSEALDLALEILMRTRLEGQEDMVRDLLRQAKLQQFQSIVMGGHVVARTRAAAQFHAYEVAQECVGGYEYYNWLRTQDNDWNYGALTETLTALYRRVVNGAALTLSLTGPEAGAETLAQGVRSLPRGQAPAEGEILTPWGLRREGIAIPADIAFAARMGELGQYSGKVALATKILDLSYLWNVIRVQGGAYGAWMLSASSGLAGCLSFRDPNAKASLEKYMGCGDFLRQFCRGNPDLTGAIIGTVSDASPLLTPRMRGQAADQHYWEGLTYETRCRRRRELLSATAEDILALAEPLDRALENSAVCVVGGQNQLASCGLDQILTI